MCQQGSVRTACVTDRSSIGPHPGVMGYAWGLMLAAVEDRPAEGAEKRPTSWGELVTSNEGQQGIYPMNLTGLLSFQFSVVLFCSTSAFHMYLFCFEIDLDW